LNDMQEDKTFGRRKLWVTCGYTSTVLLLCAGLLYVGKLSGAEFLQAVGITGVLVGGYLGANVAKGIWGKE
jgi:hypothetical protein